MKKNILAGFLLVVGTTAHASTVNLMDNSFSSVTYGGAGPITAFTETVDGVTFSFATTGQFRQVGTWENGTTQSTAPWALEFGGGSGSAATFTLSVDADIQLDSFTGFAQQHVTNPIFNVTGTGASSLGNTFSTSGFLSTGVPVVESFIGGALNLAAGETYTFTTDNAGVVTVGYIAAFDFSAPSPVPVPAAVWLFGSGLLGLIGIARRKKI